MSSVPSIATCQFLSDRGYRRKTAYYWLKRKDEKKPLLVSAVTANTATILDDVIPAPLPSELKKALPKDVEVSKNTHGYLVTYSLKNRGLFQVKKNLADALGYLWIAINDIKEGRIN